MKAELPIFPGNGTYSSWKKATTGGRFVSPPNSSNSIALIDRYSQKMNQWRKESGYKKDSEVVDWLLRQVEE